MFRHKLLIVECVFLWVVIFKSYSQETISGIVNDYKVVKAVFNGDPDDQDTVTVNDIAGLHEEDVVLIMQMRGADRSTTDGTVQNINDAGKYEFILIREFLPGNRIVVVKSFFNNYDPNEAVQLIHVPYYEDYAKATGTLTCLPWNDSTGGVLALIACDSLVLNADIDVSSAGFQGAIPDTSTGACGNVSREFQEISDLAGRKGYGIEKTNRSYTKGSNPAINGGGGDHGIYSGAGGGAGYGFGGLGGVQIDTCAYKITDTCLSSGRGGNYGNVNTYFTIHDLRIFMGGGGGTSSQWGSDTAVKGGNGAGIVIIVSKQIIGNNYCIKANGQGAGTATTGGAGGGGGGAILLDVDTITNAIRIEARGGNGGDVNHSTNCTGAGGGGGGGVLWHAWNSFKADSYTLNLYGGLGGDSKISCVGFFDGFPGFEGNSLDSLNVPLNGFLFNVMPPDQTICETETPNPIIGSNPKGGSGSYTILWEQRTKSTGWTGAAGTNNKRDYAPPALTDTTFYRRIVKSGSVSDTGFTVIINVHPLIQNNTISADQVTCSGDVPDMLQGGISPPPSGGTGSYDYQWENSTTNEIYNEIADANEPDYIVPALTDTFYYRRRINSGACVDYSDTVTIIVLGNIDNNFISKNQIICKNSIPQKLFGLTPSGGNGTYIYQWEENIDGAGWDSIASTLSNSGYQPPALIDTTQYRRIIRSGLNDVCKDTSNMVTITVLPLVYDNNVNGGDTICEATIPNDFTSTKEPGGGDGTYRYQWIWSTDSIVWDSLTTITQYDVFNPDTLYESRYFKRVVRSGFNDCCKDTSTSIWVKVYPKITGNAIYNHQEFCFGDVADTLHGSIPGGGDGVFTFIWETRTDAEGWNTTGVTDSVFVPPVYATPGNYYYRRIVNSNVCIDYSDSLLISALPLIDYNQISDNDTVCYNTAPPVFTGTLPTGGREGVYRYRWIISNDRVAWDTTSGTSQSYNSPALTEKSYFKRVVKSGLHDCCKDTSDYITIDIWYLPVAIIYAKPNPDTSCAGEERMLHFTLTGVSPWDIEYTDGINIFSVEISNPEDSIPINPTYTSVFQLVSVTDEHGCEATDMTGNVLLEVYEIPVPNPGDDTSVCGTIINLHATPSVGIGTWYLPDKENLTIDNKNDPHAQLSLKDKGSDTYNYGLYTIQWEETNWECTRVADKEITFFEQPLEINAGEDMEIYGKVETQLNADFPVVGIGTWSKISGSGRVVDSNDPKSNIDSLVMGKNLSLLWTIHNGVCIPIYDSLLIYVHPIKPPSGFSPNDDQKNDVFFINGLDVLVENELKIFNRWGHLVMRQKNYDNNWKGTNEDGNDLPEDTYFYILTGTTKYGDPYAQKGYVVIKR